MPRATHAYSLNLAYQQNPRITWCQKWCIQRSERILSGDGVVSARDSTIFGALQPGRGMERLEAKAQGLRASHEIPQGRG